MRHLQYLTIVNFLVAIATKGYPFSDFLIWIGAITFIASLIDYHFSPGEK